MRNRVPSPGKEGRMLITPENGSTPFYATVTMADEPLDEGTPLAQESLLTDATARSIWLEAVDKTPNEVFEKIAPYFQHWWQSVSGEDTYEYVEVQNPITENKNIAVISSIPAERMFYWSKTISLDKTSGEINLSGDIHTITTETNKSSPLEVLLDNLPCYVSPSSKYNGGVYYLPTGSTVGTTNFLSTVCQSGGSTFLSDNAPVVAISVSSTLTVIPAEKPIYKNSINRNTYPDYGTVDGVKYTYLGVPLNRSITAPKVATGSYIGTGTSDASNPNSLTFDFEPQVLLIVRQDYIDFGIWFNGSSNMRFFQNYSYYGSEVTLTGNTISWYYSGASSGEAPVRQLNIDQATYVYVAIGI